MKQNIQYTMAGVSASAVKASNGLQENETALGVKYCTLAVLNAARALAFTAALLFNNGKVLLRTKREALDQARTNGRAFAMLTRDILKSVFGSEPNENWLTVGFDGLAMPANVDDLLTLLKTMAAFFTANPAREVAALNITAAQAQALADALETAMGEVATQESALETLKNDRDAKFMALRGRVVQLFDELTHLMDPLDPRWTSFGFNKPGAQETPDVPENVVATLIGPTAVAVKWKAPARAEYYRVFKKVIGADEEAVAVGSPADLDFTIEGLPTNATVEIQISAVNNGGESQRSEAVTIVTHA